MIWHKINDRLSGMEGKIGIYYMDMLTGEGCFAGNCDVFASSGMAKIPLLLEVFRQIDEGVLSREDVHVLTAEDSAGFLGNNREMPYGALHFLHAGIGLTIQDLYFLMTTVSDNVAFNILLKKAGMERVNRTLEAWGLTQTRINRPLLDYEKIGQGVENYHSVKEMGELFRRLYMGQLISGQVSQEILQLMTHHQRTNVLPYYFDENQPIAHQLGFDEGRLHDMGIVLTEAPFILCMSAEGEDTRRAESVMRDIALICHRNSLEWKNHGLEQSFL